MFQRNMQPSIENVNKMTDKISSEDIYNYFLYKVSNMYNYCILRRRIKGFNSSITTIMC